MGSVGCNIDRHVGRIWKPLLLYLLLVVRSWAVPIADHEVSFASDQLKQ